MMIARQLRAKAPVAGVVSRCYSEIVIDHYENPRNVGSLDKKSKKVGTGLVGAPACGDVMKLQFELGEDGKITDAKFKTFGCGSAIGTYFMKQILSISVRHLLTVKLFHSFCTCSIFIICNRVVEGKDN
jgi:hypothetical protein